MASVSYPARLTSQRPSAKSIIRQHPQWPALLASLAAWPLTIALPALNSSPDRGTITPPGHYPHQPPVPVPVVGAVTDAAPGYLFTALHWVAMAAAMMVPLALPAVRYVARNSFRWRRQRSIAVFLTVYVGLWATFGLVASLIRDQLPVPHAVAAAVALAAGAVWPLTPYQRRSHWACHRAVPLPPRGWLAVVGVANFGARHGLACIGVCWPLMLAMVFLHDGMLAWMLALTAAMACAKLLPRTSRLSRSLPLALGGASLVAVIPAVR